MPDPVHFRDISIDTTHQKVHEGRFFSGGYYNTAIANGGTLDLLYQADAEDTMHFLHQASAVGNFTIQLFEDTTFSNVGTAVAMHNHNRNSIKTFAGTVTHTPTITAVGNQINGTELVPGGSGHKAAGASGNFAQEYVATPSKVYLLRITNIAGVATSMSATLIGYEPDL